MPFGETCPSSRETEEVLTLACISMSCGNSGEIILPLFILFSALLTFLINGLGPGIPTCAKKGERSSYKRSTKQNSQQMTDTAQLL